MADIAGQQVQHDWKATFYAISDAIFLLVSIADNTIFQLREPSDSDHLAGDLPRA